MSIRLFLTRLAEVLMPSKPQKTGELLRPSDLKLTPSSMPLPEIPTFNPETPWSNVVSKTLPVDDMKEDYSDLSRKKKSKKKAVKKPRKRK